jgi:RNA polymerase sigma-70 factor (ECF subfamily)
LKVEGRRFKVEPSPLNFQPSTFNDLDLSNESECHTHTPQGTDLTPTVAASSDEAADVALAQRGDGQAFERLYHRHVPRVHSLARRMMGDEDADELAQDVFVRAWRKLGTFRGESAFGTWLHRLAINVILGERASRGRRRERFLDAEQVMSAAPARAASVDLAMDFESALIRLPDGAREVFVLHDVEGYKHEEIAGMLGVTTGTTKAQLHRARMTLRRYL